MHLGGYSLFGALLTTAHSVVVGLLEAAALPQHLAALLPPGAHAGLCRVSTGLPQVGVERRSREGQANCPGKRFELYKSGINFTKYNLETGLA